MDAPLVIEVGSYNSPNSSVTTMPSENLNVHCKLGNNAFARLFKRYRYKYIMSVVILYYSVSLEKCSSEDPVPEMFTDHVCPVRASSKRMVPLYASSSLKCMKQREPFINHHEHIV